MQAHSSSKQLEEAATDCDTDSSGPMSGPER